MTNLLYYGDNLSYLADRDYFPDGTVDLIYLDPPFNSNARHNLLFPDPTGRATPAQTIAFKDMWNWEEDGAKEAYASVLASGSTVAPMVRAFHSFLGGSPMMAYIAMMSVRLIEMHRILKPSASLYLHCDPYASHYLKIVLDGIFAGDGFVSEIIWRRTNARSTTGRWPRLHDTLLHYAKGSPRFNPIKVKADKAKLPHTLITGPDGRKYQTYELTAPGATKAGESGQPWHGFDPSGYGRHWGDSRQQRETWDAFGLIHWPKDRGFPRRRDERPFDPEDRMVTVGDVWTDIDRLNQTAKERIGYPTQKPLALLERILSGSSNPGDLVLDPFCGCGTTIEAAERLHRQWIGIDVSHYAVDVIEGRLRDRCEDAAYTVSGRPEEIRAAHRLARDNKYEFQWWVLWRLGVQTYRERKKGADRGIDGLIFFPNGPYGTGQIIISVKGGENVGVDMVRSLLGTLEAEDALLGVFICLADPTVPMKKLAADAGFVNTAQGRFHRLQIISVPELFAGREPELPRPMADEAFVKPGRPTRRRPMLPDAQLPLVLPLMGSKGVTSEDIEDHLAGRIIPRAARLR